MRLTGAIAARIQQQRAATFKGEPEVVNLPSKSCIGTRFLK